MVRAGDNGLWRHQYECHGRAETWGVTRPTAECRGGRTRPIALSGQHPMVKAGSSVYSAAMNSSLKQTALLLLAAAFLALATAGCQTSKGFGKDVEKLGDKIQEKSK